MGEILSLRLQYNGNISNQYGHNELILFEVSSITELHDAQPPATTDASIWPRVKIVARLNVGA